MLTHWDGYRGKRLSAVICAFPLVFDCMFAGIDAYHFLLWACWSSSGDPRDCCIDSRYESICRRYDASSNFSRRMAIDGRNRMSCDSEMLSNAPTIARNARRVSLQICRTIGLLACRDVAGCWEIVGMCDGSMAGGFSSAIAEGGKSAAFGADHAVYEHAE